MSEKKLPDAPQPIATITTENLPAILQARRRWLDVKNEAEAAGKLYNATLMHYMRSIPTDRQQLEDGTVIQIVRSQDRLTVDPVLLAQAGVAPEVIAKCTVPTSVAPYIKVDEPKGAKRPAAGTVVEAAKPDRVQ